MRMRADGDSTHKGLRTAMGKPLIEWSIASLRFFGFTQIFVAVSSREPALIAWVADQQVRAIADSSVTLIVEEQPLGTIGGIRQIAVEFEDVIVVNVDNVTNLDLRALATFHRTSAATATIASHEQAFQIPYGRLDVQGDRVTQYAEKPVLVVPVSSGVYVVNRRALGAITEKGRMDIPEFVETLIGHGELVCAYVHASQWLDVNDERTLKEAEALVSSPNWPCAVCER